MRRLLPVVLVCLLLTSGCTETVRERFPGDGVSEEATIDTLVVRNHDDRSHTVEIRIGAEGELLQRTLSVGAAPERGGLQTSRTEPIELISVPPDNRSAVALASGNRSARVPLARFDRPGCTVLAVTVAADGSLGIGPGCEAAGSATPTRAESPGSVTVRSG
jgi:hypothetical protein